MKKVKLLLFGTSFALASVTMASEIGKDFVEGKIDLKSGETLEGYVSALGDYPKSSVLFKSSQSEDVVAVKHQNIKSIVKNGKTLIPQTISWEGKSVNAYLEEKESGAFKLYRAHFYAPLQRGKNSTSTELQSAWVVYSPLKGWVVLGKNVKATDLNSALTHPKSDLKLSPQIVDENQLIDVVRSLNEKVKG